MSSVEFESGDTTPASQAVRQALYQVPKTAVHLSAGATLRLSFGTPSVEWFVLSSRFDCVRSPIQQQIVTRHTRRTGC